VPIFQVLSLDAMPQLIILSVEYGVAGSDRIFREEFRLRRDRRAQLGLEQRKLL
jgi:hypothetical protein